MESESIELYLLDMGFDKDKVAHVIKKTNNLEDAINILTNCMHAFTGFH